MFSEYIVVLRPVLGVLGPFEFPHCLLQGSRTIRASSGRVITTGIVKPAERLPFGTVIQCWQMRADTLRSVATCLGSCPRSGNTWWPSWCHSYWVSPSSVELRKTEFVLLFP